MMTASARDSVTLVFVYNADSGLLNIVGDALHKAFRPSTYSCQLCAVTYAVTGMRKEWKAFIASLQLPVTFLHRDELAQTYGVEHTELPAAFIAQGEGIRPWISATDINACKSLIDLKNLVSRKLERALP